MTREIKFRMWDKRRCKMFGIKHLYLREGSVLTQGIIRRNGTDDEEVMACIEDVDIMQFTGLKDKNGKEIYEGDIIKFDNETSEVCFGEWDNGFSYGDNENGYGWYLKQIQGDSIVTVHSFNYLRQENREVIGNVYEQPEILGGE